MTASTVSKGRQTRRLTVRTHARAMPYAGGKVKLGRWIVEQLPRTVNCTYVEPFGGMLGVLLQKPPSRTEIVNDLNERIVNWWTVVRENPDGLADWLEFTPASQVNFDLAVSRLDDTDPLRRAWALSVVLCDSYMHSDATKSQNYQTSYAGSGKQLPNREQLRAVATRLRNVQLEHGDALKVLERTADRAYTVLYVDPPYPSTVGSNHYRYTPDWERLTELLQAQKGQVAVSGYVDEWDHLGWRKVSRRAYSHVGNAGRRVEHLWCNYPAEADACPVR